MTIAVIGDNTGNDYSGTEDAYIKSNATTTNFGSGETKIDITKYAADDHTHQLLKFSGIDSLPASITVNSATLTLNKTFCSGASNQTIQMYRLLRNWGEATCTWNTYDGSNNWGTAGATNATDRSSTVSAESTTVGDTNGEDETWSAANLATDVQNFRAGTWSNYGWHMERTDGSNDSTYRNFTVSTDTDGDRPYITIDYTVGGAATSVGWCSNKGGWW